MEIVLISINYLQTRHAIVSNVTICSPLYWCVVPYCRSKFSCVSVRYINSIILASRLEKILRVRNACFTKKVVSGLARRNGTYSKLLRIKFIVELFCTTLLSLSPWTSYVVRARRKLQTIMIYKSYDDPPIHYVFPIP